MVVPPSSAQIRSKKGFRFAVFLAVAGVALVWNLALLAGYQGWVSSGAAWAWTDWLLILLFLPCGAAGLALAALAVYLGVPLGNPRVTFEVFPPAAPPGETVEVAWKIEGALERVRSVGVVLEGREEAWRETRFGPIGRSAVFRRVPVFRTAEPDRIRSGGAAVRLPDDLIPSFNGRTNRLAWYLCIHGGFGRWPNLRQELALTVLPPRGGRG